MYILRGRQRDFAAYLKSRKRHGHFQEPLSSNGSSIFSTSFKPVVFSQKILSILIMDNADCNHRYLQISVKPEGLDRQL